MDENSFDTLVSTAIEDLPEEFKRTLQNIAIVTKDEPDTADLQAAGISAHASLFGLYQGIPLTKRAGSIISMPDKITIFKGPIIRSRRTPEAIREQIKATVLHEIGHYFGMSEVQIREIEKKRQS